MISFQGVSYSYETNSHESKGTSKSLDNIDLEIRDGECVVLCGKSGCGKTTLTRLLNGMIPDFYGGKIEGKVLLDGRNISELPMHEIAGEVGSVFQNPRTQFYTVNTTSEIAFGCENLGMRPEYIARRVEQTAKDLQIEHLLDKDIFSLSGGEKQIIAFAGIYAMSPKVYVLDEPSSNLDIQAIEKIRRILALLKQQGRTIVIAEHRLYYLKELADRAVYLEEGRIAGEYSMGELARFTREEQLHSGIRTVELFSYPAFSRQRAGCPARSEAGDLAAGKHFLKLEKIRCFYGKKEVLNISGLTLASGRITAVIGKNGAGKSTFVSCLCGLLRKAEGTVFSDGKKQTKRERIRDSYLVMQEVNYQLFSDSVREEIILGRGTGETAGERAGETAGITEGGRGEETAGMKEGGRGKETAGMKEDGRGEETAGMKEKRKGRISENRLRAVMADLDLEGLEERHPRTLSGGQKQRVIIASAFMCGKKILYFDEPTSGLDFSHMMETCGLLKRLQKEDTFLFIITHDYEMIMSVCDSVIHIENGTAREQYLLDENGRGKLREFFSGACAEKRE